MDPAILASLKELLAQGDIDGALIVLEQLMAGAGEPETVETDPAPDSALAESADPPSEDEEQARASAGADPETARAAAPKAAAKAANSVDPAVVQAAAEQILMTLVPGAKTVAAAKASIAGAVARQASADHAERLALIAELVQLGAETPATAWRGEASKRVPVTRLASEPVIDMRARVAAMRAARPTPTITPPVVAEGDLTESERARAARMKPEQKERFMALRAQRRSTARA